MDGLALSQANQISERPKVAIPLKRLAVIHSQNGNLVLAEELLRDAVAIKRKVRVPMHPRLADRLSTLASLLINQNRKDKVARCFRRFSQFVNCSFRKMIEGRSRLAITWPTFRPLNPDSLKHQESSSPIRAVADSLASSRRAR